MQVELLYHTPDPERAIATAARLCYAPVGAAELMEAMPEERVKSVLSTIMSAGHTSTLEHASYTFAVDGVSRALTHQLVRHRLASYNQLVGERTRHAVDGERVAGVLERGEMPRRHDGGKDAFDALLGHGLHQLGGAHRRVAQARGRGDGALGIGGVVQQLDLHGRLLLI